MADENAMQWPSDPALYEWKGTLSQTNTTWIVLAHCKQKKTDVVIKIKQFKTNNEEDSLRSIEEFSNHLKTLIKIKHVNLLTPIHSFFFKNEVWSISPRHSGGVLSELLTSHYPNGIHDEQLLAYLLMNVARGLSYLHKNQTCHRNIRPSSIYFDREMGITLLSQFGELKTIKFKKQYQQTESMISPTREPWLDPLIIIKHPKISWYDGDIYSLGVTALHLVFGSPPSLNDNALSKALMKLVSSESDSNANALYNQIGIHSYSDTECMIKSPLFEQFVSDCTSPISQRPSIDKLLAHPFFEKKNTYTADIVREKIGHLFQSAEDRTNAAFTAPHSFPNVTGTLPKEVKELKTEHGNEEQKTEWNFSTTKSIANRVHEQGRFTVEEAKSSTRSSVSSNSDVYASDGVKVRTKSAEWVGDWVACFGLAYRGYKRIFVENGIDGAMLKELNDEMLKEIIPSKLHRSKIIFMTKKLFG